MRQVPASLLLCLLVAACGGGGSSGSVPAPAATTPPPGTISEYTVPTSNADVTNITVGPDGNLWFLESLSSGSKIGKITTGGAITEYSFPSSVQFPGSIITGPDKNLWVTDEANHLISVTTAGSFNVYSAAGMVMELTIGPDNNLWGPEFSTNMLDAYSTAGALVHQYPLGYTNQNVYVATGSDTNIWIAGYSPTLARVTTSGTVSTFSLTPPMSATGWMRQITSGPDGNLWICANTDNLILKVSTAGALIASYPIPTANASPYGITTGPDGNLWFTENQGDKIGRITTSGTITEFPVPTANAQPYWIVAGPDGKLWFTEANGNKVASILP